MLTYRPLLREQVPIFASLHYQCWMETYPGLIPQAYLDQMSLEKNIARFDALYDLIGAYQYLVYEDEKPVGLFDISPAREQVEDCLSEVQGLYLSKASHGKGIGRAIITYVQEVLRAREEHAFYLWCLQSNPTVHFYEHMGGQIVTSREVDFSGVNLTEVCFVFRF